MKFLHLFTNNLPADEISENYTRQVPNAAFSFIEPIVPKNPKLIHFSEEMFKKLGLEANFASSAEFLNLVSGTKRVSNEKPFAMNYAGHQFGNWAGQLGDGRAIVLGEIENNSEIFTLQLKGAGPTPYSRNADGFAVLRSSIREYLCAEAMHYLGVPTTRSLSLVATGDQVLRVVMYNGNPVLEPGAIVCRVAPSFIRFGSFENLSAQGNIENLRKLADYTIENYYAEIKSKDTQKYIVFFENVAQKTMEMVVHWQRVGFVHGVMNTDNMSIHGITIDYGPYGWLEDYNPNWTPNTTDAQGKRYRFGNQANIALWNLYQLANALFPLIEEAEPLEKILNNFAKNYDLAFMKMMHEKYGIVNQTEKSKELINLLLENLQLTETDYTLFFRNLSLIEKTDIPDVCLSKISFAFYNLNEIQGRIKETWLFWLSNYLLILNQENQIEEIRSKNMNLVNPKYVFRNYMAQMAIDLAEKEDYSLINEFYELLKMPYDEQPENEKWFAKRPDWAKNKTGSSMLSCSS